jgi:DNA-binding NtrC family response regulator
MTVATRKNRLLVVDDERVIADTLALSFSSAGYEARAVYSAEQAISLLSIAEWLPNLAVIDVRLPGMHGIDLAILMKAEYPQVHVILFSGQAATADLLDLARSQGHVFDVVAKPVPPREILELIATTLANQPGGNVPARSFSGA